MGRVIEEKRHFSKAGKQEKCITKQCFPWEIFLEIEDSWVSTFLIQKECVWKPLGKIISSLN